MHESNREVNPPERSNDGPVRFYGAGSKELFRSSGWFRDADTPEAGGAEGIKLSNGLRELPPGKLWP